MWYTRLIQELNWVANPKENCSIAQVYSTSPEEQRIYDTISTRDGRFAYIQYAQNRPRQLQDLVHAEDEENHR